MQSHFLKLYISAAVSIFGSGVSTNLWCSPDHTQSVLGLNVNLCPKVKFSGDKVVSMMSYFFITRVFYLKVSFLGDLYLASRLHRCYLDSFQRLF